MTKVKKRNPQDATLRNIRALKKRVDELEHQMVLVKDILTGLYKLNRKHE